MNRYKQKIFNDEYNRLTKKAKDGETFTADELRFILLYEELLTMEGGQQ